MSLIARHTLLGTTIAVLVPCVSTTEAQIVRRLAGGGIQVNAPFAGVRIGPGGSSVDTPIIAIGRNRRGFFARRRAQLGRAPYPDPQQAPPEEVLRGRQPQPNLRQQAQQRQVQVRQAQQRRVQALQAPLAGRNGQVSAKPIEKFPLPSQNELAALNDLDLQAVLSGFSSQLDQRLERFNTGAGWRKHLSLPSVLLGSAHDRKIQLRETLARFDSVVNDPKFAKISGLNSFSATHAALGELVGRLEEPTAVRTAAAELSDLEGPRIIEPTSGQTVSLDTKSNQRAEVLPTPAAALKPAVPSGERSILRRK